MPLPRTSDRSRENTEIVHFTP
jgi:hypothetical protein